MAVPLATLPSILDRYRIEAVVGRGSFGRVLRVVEVASGELRALKIVARGPHEAMLLDEFEQLARLRHRSLPAVYEVGRTREAVEDLAEGAPFFVAEWIEGARSDARPWTDLAALWSLLADLAGALATIHAGGLVHGDVAPQNILIAADRAVLVDLGLASGGGARGTPAYMAPEALAGHVEPRSDLYGLGASIVRIVSGRPPFEGATLGELAQRILAGAAPRPLPGVPAPLADLIRRLLARDASDRPASAVAVLDELDQLAPAIAPGSARRARPKVGAPPAPARWTGAAAVVDAVTRDLGSTDAAIVIAGIATSGSRQLADAAAQRWQLAQVARQQPAIVIAGALDEIAVSLGVSPATNGGRGWIERFARAARRATELVVIDLADDPRGPDLLAALTRSPGSRPVIVVADSLATARPGVALHAAPLLDAIGIGALAGSMLGREPPMPWAKALLGASGGHPLTAIELVRSIAGERDPFAIDWAARSSAGAVDLRAKQLKAIAAGPRRVAAALAAWGGRARIDRVLATLRAEGGKTPVGLADVVELERAGLARRSTDDVVLDRATLDATESVIGADAIAKLAATALAAVGRAAAQPAGSPPAAVRGPTQPTDGRAPTPPTAGFEPAPLAAREIAVGDRARIPAPLWLAPLLERAPMNIDRAALACEIAEQLIAHGRFDRAIAIAKRAITAAPARAGLLAARASAAGGAYREASALARAAETAGADPVEAQLVIARAAQRGGELDAAEAVLARLHAAHPTHPEVAGTYARLLVTRSRYAKARTVAVTDGAPLAGLRAEAAGLAAFYLGALDDADAAFSALEVAAVAADDTATVGRALSLHGMVAQQRGQLGLASDRYREAARRLADVGELHAAATAELNLGTVLSERGRASEALPRLAAAGRVFAELGASTELCAAELNRANALLAVGQVEDARVAAETAVARAEGAPHLRAFALLVLGDARKRLGDTAGAIRGYREALAIGVDRGDAHAQLSAHVALAEAGQIASVGGRIAEAAPGAAFGDAALAIEAMCASPDDRDRWTLARGRLALDDGSLSVDRVRLLAIACAEAAARAGEADRLERAFRGHAIAAALAQRARDAGLASVEADHARAAHAAMLAATAQAFRAALDDDADLVRLPGASDSPRRDAAPRGGRAARERAEAPHLRRLLTLSRRLNTEASVERILDDVIDTAIELTAAERGFLLLRRDGGELAPVVSRNFTTGDLETAHGSPTVSRSIAERAAQTGEPVLTVDAGVDERFGMAASVAALRLRSVLAVPLRQRGSITGCIYVDHRLRGGAFDADAAAVLGELADIAAIAIENARLTEDLRNTTRAVDELNGRLSAELAERDAELVRVKAELPDRDRLRHGYEKIVGRSAATVRMLDIIDRAAATALPVVIVGESGTGKELVARALHDHGPRKAGAFVAINCSAVPEPLLESELFGHVRGAFTGAERDRRGLFEVADGGTLFLDEIADTSAAMQAKLLRVLQDGMIRRVGDTATRKVDVRVIAATQHPLADLVIAGRFREDLRFRLEVITVPVPALRDRDGDIPILVEHMLAALTPGVPAPKITRAAVRALAQHRWPGNIRELENALARGVAMGGDVIDVGDLPEAIAQAAARPEPAKPALGEDLRLKPALGATEQAYITAAMSRAKGNQTVAARLLGLSRFGLQKKLRRLAGDDDASDED
ncbi:MAG: sigma 54-interacting transcriptional regulator [Deltaproteobacteria bacterium]|nr:sigma 54-interacting transcriptional regulator [Deltaproteobacteria bacterium]